MQNYYMPGAVPADYNTRNAFLNYERNVQVPEHRVKCNFLADLPFGKGKKFGGNVSSLVDKFIGVWIPLKNGTTVRTTYNPILNPFQNQWFPVVLQWSQNASLFKVVQFKERYSLRINADFFNVFNHPGNPNSVGADGMEVTQASGNSPRTLQLSLRFTF